jgi:hypothetical protein
MGITEYVASRHTFRILICVIHDGMNVNTLTLARRIHAAAANICGLYAHATTAATDSADSLFRRIASQYRMILYIDTTTAPHLHISGPPEATAILQDAFDPAAAAVTITHMPPTDRTMRVAIGASGLDDAATRTRIADNLAAALLRLCAADLARR